MSKFELNLSGYLQARQWLLDIGKWKEIEDRNLADIMDVVHIANLLWAKNMT
jgi:hypothetical protein